MQQQSNSSSQRYFKNDPHRWSKQEPRKIARNWNKRSRTHKIQNYYIRPFSAHCCSYYSVDPSTVNGPYVQPEVMSYHFHFLPHQVGHKISKMEKHSGKNAIHQQDNKMRHQYLNFYCLLVSKRVGNAAMQRILRNSPQRWSFFLGTHQFQAQSAVAAIFLLQRQSVSAWNKPLLRLINLTLELYVIMKSSWILYVLSNSRLTSVRK